MENRQQHVFIIAEAGVNHNGDMNLAKQLIDAAKAAGADAVKFQTFKTEKLVSKTAEMADYQKANTGNNAQSQFDMLKKLELSEHDHQTLLHYCNEKQIQFLSTPFDEESLAFLVALGISVIKIPSGEITNKPFLKKVAQTGKPIIMSTGMSDMNEINAALKVLIENGAEKKNLFVLHCNTDYPTKMEDVNLLAMLTIAKETGVNIGYSDHTLGIEVPVAATALGAKIIEKHFTISRTLEGPDHKASLEPEELKEMVRSIRNIERALEGNGVKQASNSEKANKTIARKSIHVAQLINPNDTFSYDNLVIMRPGDGISPMDIDDIVGKRANKTLKPFEKLSWDDIENNNK